MCRGCSQDISAGTPVVTVFFWMKGDERERRWNIKNYYHPQCWGENGLDYLKLNPYVPYVRKQRLELGDDKRKQRYCILRKKAMLEQRKQKLNPSNEGYTLAKVRLEEKISKLFSEIALVGGIPRKWVDTI